MSARDDDTDDRLSLIKFLRDHDSIPTKGHIVSVKAPNVITVESRQGTFDIHLEGVRTEGLSDAQKRRALDFLRALSRGDSKLSALLNERNLCENSEGLPVSLVYETQFFQDGKTLSALVRIGTYTHICLKDGSVAVDTLDPNGVVTFGNDLSLNHLLVASGLALVDEDVDPRWPEPIVDARNLYLETIHDPKTAGDNKFPAIDDVIAHSSELN